MIELRLAPMAAVTKVPFRLVCREAGAGRLTSEELDANAVVRKNAQTWEMARFLEIEQPISLQLIGGDPDVLADAARMLEATGVDGIDLNMGCPVPKIVKKGHGAALMRDPLTAGVIFRTMRKAVAGAFTIKIRGGWDDHTVNAPEIARIAESEGVDQITVHPRTRAQQYTGRAPWDVIASVVAAVSVPVIGNGDVRSMADAEAMRRSTGCAAVMVGRGALGRPWLFGGVPVGRDEQARMIRRHCALMEEHLAPHDAHIQTRKHLAWYAADRPGMAALRRQIFDAHDCAEALDIFWSAW